MNEFDKLAGWADPLIQALSPAQRRQLLRKLVITLRRENQQRIQQQINPDGEPFVQRRKHGNKKMFVKLRQSRYLKTAVTADSATVQFAGRAARIAAVHHFGLEDDVDNNGPRIRYSSRELLGFSPQDENIILDFFLEHLS